MSEQNFTTVGTRPVRHDGVDKVTGRANYGADLSLPGMLHGVVVRSPHAHARIRSIDTSAAARVPGVKGIVTGPVRAGARRGPSSIRHDPLQQSAPRDLARPFPSCLRRLTWTIPNATHFFPSASWPPMPMAARTRVKSRHSRGWRSSSPSTNPTCAHSIRMPWPGAAA
jgi:hypothetical protein